MNILEKIYRYKIEFVKESKAKNPLTELKKKSLDTPKKENNFLKKLKNKTSNINIIGELKRASPSAGNIVNEEIDLLKVSKIYENNGIACLSILTDEKYFKGSINDLTNIRKVTSLPILRKDFIVDKYQVYESFLSGADCILIIMALIHQDLAFEIEELAASLGIDSIIEVHNEEEIYKSTFLKSDLIGINNRNLKNFSVDINNSINLSKSRAENKIIISESGIKTKKDINFTMKNSKIKTFLIGESLISSNNIDVNIRNLLT